MRLLTSPLIYVAAISVLPVLCGYADVRNNYIPQEILQACELNAIAAVVMLVVLRLVLRDLHKAAIITALAIVGFYSYATVLQALSGIFYYNLLHINSAISAAYCAILIAALFFLSRTGIDWKLHAATINIITVGLCLYNLFPIWAEESQIKAVAARVSFDHQGMNERTISATKNLPDIYLIVVDALGSPCILQDQYHYNSAALVNFLEQSGFFVVPKSRSNYDRTPLSFCSFLNMDYLDPLISIMGKGSRDENPCTALAGDNLASKRLRQAGYRIINVRSGHAVTDFLKCDKTVDSGINTYTMSLLMQSPIGAFDNYTHWLSNAAAKMKLKAFTAATSISQYPGPKFVIMHTLICHEPYIFNEDGSLRNLSRLVLAQAPDRGLYAGQLKYATSRLEGLVSALLAQPENKPVIIILSDHGPWVGVRPAQRETDEFYNERMQNFEAFYFPDHDYSSLYPQISPVNSLRVVLNKYLGTQMKILPDRSYIAKERELYDQKDVTDRLKFGCNSLDGN